MKRKPADRFQDRIRHLDHEPRRPGEGIHREPGDNDPRENQPIKDRTDPVHQQCQSLKNDPENKHENPRESRLLIYNQIALLTS